MQCVGPHPCAQVARYLRPHVREAGMEEHGTGEEFGSTRFSSLTARHHRRTGFLAAS